MSDVFEVMRITDTHYMARIPMGLLATSFRDWWIPDYQRDRVMQPKKIRDLVEIFKSKGTLDAVKINYRGATKFNDDGSLEIDWLKGHFSIIDGQQRILAGIDSGVTDYILPVELYFNLTRDEEIHLFHQFNRKPTRLTMSDLIKSSKGSYTVAAKNVVKDPSFPIPVRINQRAAFDLAFFARLITDTHRFVIDGRPLATLPKSKTVFYLFDESISSHTVEHVLSVIKRIFESYVELVGNYDYRSIAWHNASVVSYFRTTLHNFLTRDGLVDYGIYEQRIKLTATVFHTNSFSKEILRNGSQSGITFAHRCYIDFLNFKRSANKIPYPGDLSPEQVAALVVPEQAKPVIVERDPWLTE